MAGIFDDLLGAVGSVAAAAQPSAPIGDTTTPAGQTPAGVPSVIDRLTALEGFVATWGPVVEKLAPLMQKLDSL